MPTYRVQVRLNLRPNIAVELVDTLSTLLPNTGLRLRSGVPGLIEGENLSPTQLDTVLDYVGKLLKNKPFAEDLERTGLLDDVWIHITREPKAQ